MTRTPKIEVSQDSVWIRCSARWVDTARVAVKFWCPLLRWRKAGIIRIRMHTRTTFRRVGYRIQYYCINMTRNHILPPPVLALAKNFYRKEIKKPPIRPPPPPPRLFGPLATRGDERTKVTHWWAVASSSGCNYYNIAIWFLWFAWSFGVGP